MATNRETLKKYEAKTAKMRDKLRHAELLHGSEFYGRLARARSGLNALLLELGEGDLTADGPLRLARAAIEERMLSLRRVPSPERQA